jgi:hypothetical protein
MEPKQRKGQKAEFFRRCCKRVKCFVGKLMILLLLVTRPKGFLSGTWIVFEIGFYSQPVLAEKPGKIH